MRRAVGFLIPVVFLAACGGGQSPIEPSLSSSGANITGHVVSAGTADARRVRATSSATAPALTVTVAGTDIRAPVQAGGFTLRGVPGGPLSLRFAGAGVSAELGLAPVEGSEDIDLTVAIDGSTVVLQSERRSLGREVQLEGLVESLPPSTEAGAFAVAGQLVTTTSGTRFFLRGGTATFDDLALGFRVHVKGQTDSDAVVASIVNIQNTNIGTDDEEADDEAQNESASIEDVLTTVGGTTPTLVLQVGATTVHTTATTVVRRRGDTQDLVVLQPGMRLHVVGDRQPDASLVARMIQIKGDAPGSAFEIAGAMGGVSGTCPALTFTINGFKIATDAATTFSHECATFRSGTKATVEGTVQPDLSIMATSVTKS